MNTADILADLAHSEGLPKAAIRLARARRAESLPEFIDLVERCAADDPSIEPIAPALFFVFHLLGEWHEQSAYRPLARLLMLDTDKVEDLLGDAITESSHRVMAAVFDGDPQPLYDVIEAEEADPFVRSRMFETLAMVTLQGVVAREETARYLRDSFMSLRPHEEDFVWHGWQSAIALLGLEDLSQLVKKAFDRGLISAQTMSFTHFKADLKRALAEPDAPWHPNGSKEFTLFGDTIEELSGWHAFSPEYRGRQSAWASEATSFEQATNPFRGIGRNDPCPCGSGQKFKKCCLNLSSPNAAGP